jgi:hypothetical protein
MKGVFVFFVVGLSFWWVPLLVFLFGVCVLLYFCTQPLPTLAPCTSASMRIVEMRVMAAARGLSVCAGSGSVSITSLQSYWLFNFITRRTAAPRPSLPADKRGTPRPLRPRRPRTRGGRRGRRPCRAARPCKPCILLGPPGRPSARLPAALQRRSAGRRRLTRLRPLGHAGQARVWRSTTPRPPTPGRARCLRAPPGRPPLSPGRL